MGVVEIKNIELKRQKLKGNVLKNVEVKMSISILYISPSCFNRII